MLSLLVSCGLLFSPAAPVPARAQDGEARDQVVDKRPEVRERVESFKDHVKARGREDSDARALVVVFLNDWENTGPKDRKEVIAALSASFKQKRFHLEDGRYDNELYIAVATGLGEMAGPDASKALQSWIGHKQHRKNLDLQRALILALGRTREPGAVKSLIALLKHEEPLIQQAGAEALGDYEEADVKTRKKIFEAVLKQIAPMHSDVQNDTRYDPILRHRYDTVAGSMIATLRLMSGFAERDPLEFQRWWNKNKKADWDKLP